METPEQQQSTEALFAEKEEIMQMIEQKRIGRKAMEDSGIAVELEADDMDMQDLQARLAEIDVLLGNDPDQPRLEML